MEINIESGLTEILIPPMALQTLVENAVKFGVERNRLGSTIHIAARLRDGMAQIESAKIEAAHGFAATIKCAAAGELCFGGYNAFV